MGGTKRKALLPEVTVEDIRRAKNDLEFIETEFGSSPDPLIYASGGAGGQGYDMHAGDNPFDPLRHVPSQIHTLTAMHRALNDKLDNIKWRIEQLERIVAPMMKQKNIREASF